MKPFRLSLLLMALALLAACSRAPAATPTPLPEPPTPLPTAAAAAPTAEPTTAPAPAPSTEAAPTPTAGAPTDTMIVTAVSYAGISFNYTPDIAAGVETSDEPGADPGDGGLVWFNYPAHTLLTFSGYPLTDVLQPARVQIFPAQVYASLNVGAREEIERLEKLLAERPSTLPANLPFLPIPNAAQITVAQAEYVSFTNGAGIRYLTTYAQALFPIINRNLFYTFQGLTNDGASYVSAVFPVRSDALPDDTGPEFDYLAFEADYESYIAETTALLNDLPGDAFTPMLAQLDALVQSLEIVGEPITRRTDASGRILLTITSPVAAGQAFVGAPFEIHGYTDPEGVEFVELTLEAGPNVLATQTAPVDDATGDWRATLDAPANVVGEGRITARAGAQSITVPIFLLENQALRAGPAEPAIVMLRPVSGEAAAAGYPLYFEGTVRNPINDSVAIGVLVDNCSRLAAQQSFTVAGGGSWFGLIILPREALDDRACATVYTGVYGEEWREVQQRLPVLAPDDERVARISLERWVDLTFRAGGTAALSGMAVDADEVTVVLKSSVDESVLAEGTAVVGDFGFWEIQLPVPADAPGTIFIEVTIPNPEGEPYRTMTSAAVAR